MLRLFTRDPYMHILFIPPFAKSAKDGARDHLLRGERGREKSSGSTTLGRPPHTFPEHCLHQVDEALRIERLEPEGNIEPLIGRLRFGQTAQHHHRKRKSSPPQLRNKLRTAHDRHQVIGNDQTDVLRRFCIAKQFQRLLTLQSNVDFPSTPLQDRPAGGRLNMVIIHQQYVRTHSQRPSTLSTIDNG
jgi:hypothetical protein